MHKASRSRSRPRGAEPRARHYGHSRYDFWAAYSPNTRRAVSPRTFSRAESELKADHIHLGEARRRGRMHEHWERLGVDRAPPQ